MSRQIVGLENLPNVYIKKITLSDNTTNSYTGTIRIELMDMIENKKEIWSNNDLFTPFIKVCLIHTLDEDLSDQLSSGVLSPLPMKVVLSQYYNLETTKVFDLSLKELNKSHTEGISLFQKDILIDIPSEVQYSAVYVCSYLDTKMASQHWGIELSGDLEQYFGAIASDKIFENSVVPTSTNIFISPDNTLWTGPVHLHQQNGYMQGSLHSMISHEKLTIANVKNMKIIDNRTFVDVDTSEVSLSPNANIGDMEYSIDTQDNLVGTFAINIEQITAFETMYGSKLYSLNKEIFRDLMNTQQINSLTITRELVKIRNTPNPLGTQQITTDVVLESEVVDSSIDTGPGVFKNTETLKEIHLSRDPAIRYFTFTDDSKTSRSSGLYKYSISLTTIDKSQDFVDSYIEELHQTLAELDNIINLLSRRARYDYDADALKPNVQVPVSIVNIVKKYYQTFCYFNKVTAEEKALLINNKVSSLATGNYTTVAAQLFRNEFAALISLFLEHFKVSEGQNTTTKAKNIKKSSIPNIIVNFKEFKDIIQFSDYRRSYDCLRSPSSGLSVLTQEAFKKRADFELKRFFDGSKSFLFSKDVSLPPEIKSSILDLSKSKSLFLSPVKFMFDGDSVDIVDLSTLDLDKLSRLFLDSSNSTKLQIKQYRSSFANQTKRSVRASEYRGTSRGATTKKVSFSFTRAPNSVKTKDVLEEQYAESTDYLGNSSEFKDIEDSFKIVNLNLDDEKIAESLDNAADSEMVRDKKQFDVSIPGNVIDKFSESSGFSLDKLRKAPLSFKALVASRSPAAKNNIISSDVDIFKDPDVRIATEMVFQTAQKIQMLAGYEKNPQGINMLTKPIWVDMDPSLLNHSSRVLCRMQYAEIPELDIKPSPQYRLEVRDKVFVISDVNAYEERYKATEVDQAEESVMLRNDLSTKIKYATSKIVKQNPNKSPIKSPAKQSTGATGTLAQSSPSTPNYFTGGGSY